MNGKRYDKDFKTYAVKMVVEDGRKVAEVARELDLVHQTLHKWVDKYKEEQGEMPFVRFTMNVTNLF